MALKKTIWAKTKVYWKKIYFFIGSIPLIIFLIRLFIIPYFSSKAESFVSILSPEVYPELLIYILTSISILFWQILHELKPIHHLANIGAHIRLVQPILAIANNFSSLYNSYNKNLPTIQNTKYLNDLTTEIVNVSSSLIDKIASHPQGSVVQVNNEYQRIIYLRNLFKLKNTAKIIALTYDYNNYFMNFWSGLQLDQFVDVNLDAAKHASIERYFIFSKSKNNHKKEKKELLIDIFKDFEAYPQINTFLIWEEDLKKVAPSFQKRSFLLIDNFISSEVKYTVGNDELPGYISFGNTDKIKLINKKIAVLESIRKEELTLQEIDTIWNTDKK